MSPRNTTTFTRRRSGRLSGQACLFLVLSGIVLNLRGETFSPQTLHDLKPVNGAFEVTGEDPFVVFNWKTPTPDEPFQVICRPTDADALPFTLDLFVETDHHGFSENHKLTFELPGEGTPAGSELRASQLLEHLNLETEHLRRIRLDPNLPVGSQLQLQLVSRVENAEAPVSLGYYLQPDPKDIQTGLPVEQLNSLGVESGKLRVINGDPHVIFRMADLPIADKGSLLFELTPSHPVRKYTYLEIFWSTGTHGFSEAYKAFFLYPLSPVASPPVRLDIHELISAVETGPYSIERLRFDFEYPFTSPFQIKLKPLDSSAVDQYDSVKLGYTLHPHFLNRSDTASRAARLAVTDFLSRLAADPLFTLFYLLLLTCFCFAGFKAVKRK